MSTINGKACVANGRNLIVQSDLKNGYLNKNDGKVIASNTDFYSDNYIPTNGATVFTLSSPDYVYKGDIYDKLIMYDSNKKFIGYQFIYPPTQTLSKPNVAYIRISINFVNEGGVSGKLSDWLNSHRYKLETGTTATPWTPAPVDKVFSDGKQVYGRNLVTGTSNELTTMTRSGWGGSPANSASGAYGSGKYYASVYIENTAPVGINIFVRVNGRTSIFYGNTIQPGKNGVSNIVFDILEGQSLNSVWAGFASQQTESYTYKYKEMMIKRDQSAWTPAPEDVM